MHRVTRRSEVWVGGEYRQTFRKLSDAKRYVARKRAQEDADYLAANAHRGVKAEMSASEILASWSKLSTLIQQLALISSRKLKGSERSQALYDLN